MNQDTQFQPMISAAPFIRDGARLLIKALSPAENEPDESVEVLAAPFFLPPVLALPHGTVSYMLPSVTADSSRPTADLSQDLEQMRAIETLATEVLVSRQIDGDQFIQLIAMAGIVISALFRLASQAEKHEQLWLVEAAMESAFHIVNRLEGPHSQRGLRFGQILWTSYVKQGKAAQPTSWPSGRIRWYHWHWAKISREAHAPTEEARSG